MTATTCKAPKASCGTASGWRAGGRCLRCRLAHNNDTSRRRGLTDAERYDFLAALRNLRIDWNEQQKSTEGTTS